MSNNTNTQSLISLLRQTHNAEWEATRSSHDAIAWLNDLVQFLFPSNHLPKKVLSLIPRFSINTNYGLRQEKFQLKLQ